MLKKTFLLLACTATLLACKEKKNRTTLPGENKAPKNTAAPKDASFAFIGTYTRKEGHVDGKAEGVYLLQREGNDGQLKIVTTAAKMTNPSFLAISPDRQNLYAVSEVARENETGALHVFALDDFKKPVFLQELPTDAKAPCHVNLDHKGKYVFVANYVGGVVKMYKRDKKGLLSPADTVQLNGSGPDTARQGESHPHSVAVSPDDRFIFIPDLGSDKIWIFGIDGEKDRLVPAPGEFAATSPGAGPRHFIFHPEGHYAYVINELNNTIHAYAYDAEEGKLTEIQTINTLPEGFEGQSNTADIHIHPNGKFLYGSNRGHNSIAVYAIDPDSGKLSLVQHESTRGDFPRNFAIHPSGKQLYAANQNSGNIVQFDIDPETGRLSYEGQLDVKSPVCITFYP
ncbi:lactonase family protein [Sinomicrobium weinanense]|uniref:Lactonase family protein n=1 Tax=Sinomicrobium weinanense TaxID=2842200 RepID=A0A926JSS0_9FLAO|nr:lactonase family protein [Sinomicrobium weinanense]MBC9796684.1 lactonase family protein [Sinomicrobium weinanense]MBU3123041.1 lactonase family protein [Sinomicrobium weinanense]